MDKTQFRDYAIIAFQFLGEYGFDEVPSPEGKYVNPFLVGFSNGVTWVGVEGINYGFGIDIRLASVDRTLMKEQSYAFGDLMAIRDPGFEFIKSKPTDTRDIQMAQMDHCAAALNAHAKDVLKGDFAVFPQLAEAIAERRRKNERDRNIDQSKLNLAWIELAERQLKLGGMNDTFRKTLLKILDAGDEFGIVACSNPSENDQQNQRLTTKTQTEDVMTTAATTEKTISYESLNPELDLVFERLIDVRPELVWAAWTKPEYIKKWFTPAPWKTIDCEVDLKPGGMFRTVMRSPDGDEFPNVGCYLELIENRKLVWTGAMEPGFRPRDTSKMPFVFTAMISFTPEGDLTGYTAKVLHSDVAGKEKHEKMGFHDGWGRALDQLVALAKTMPH